MAVALQIFRVMAACSSIFMLLSPTPMVYKMYRDHDTGVMSIVPLLAVLVNSNTWMMYGYLDENYIPVFVKSVAGNVIASTYVIVFYRSTKNRASVHNALAIAGFVIVATSLYVILGGLGYTGQTRHQAAQIAGIMANVTGMFMYGSPLVKIVQVFKYKSAVFIPVHMVCMGATNNMIWITYSILSSKWLILIPAAGAFCLSIFQVTLYLFIYNPSTHPLPADFAETNAVDKGHTEASLSVVIDSPGAHKTDFVALNSTRSSASQQHNQHCDLKT